MKNWFGKHRQTLCTLLICAMGCGLLVVLLYPYKCWEEGCYNLAFDGIYCEQHRAEKIEESKREEEERKKRERAELIELQKKKEEELKNKMTLTVDEFNIKNKEIAKASIEFEEHLPPFEKVDDDYIPAMIRRNEEASVYMGLGLAIPHGTEDAKKNVKKSGIIVMQYPEGVEFNGGTAQLVIGIAGVGDEHLEILGQITEAVTEEEILEELKKTTDVDYILNTFTN